MGCCNDMSRWNQSSTAEIGRRTVPRVKQSDNPRIIPTLEWSSTYDVSGASNRAATNTDFTRGFCPANEACHNQNEQIECLFHDKLKSWQTFFFFSPGRNNNSEIFSRQQFWNQIPTAVCNLKRKAICKNSSEIYFNRFPIVYIRFNF